MASHTSPLTALVVPEPSDAGTPGFGWSSPSPSQSSGGNHIESRAQRAASKRRAASEWIGMALGVSVPHETDQAFRRALADGVTLCRLVNWLRPGSIPKVVEAMPDGSGTPSHATGDVIQTFENVTNFIRVARDLTGETFSARDLEEGGEERPGLVAKHGLAAAAADAPDGLNHLMRSCTHMLRSRMGLGASSPAPDAGPRRGDEAEAGSTQAPVPAYALDAVGPVLESVLSNLTSEYEKRLLAKDQDVVEPGPDGALGVYSARHGRWHHFRFDAVFGQSADQEEVYAETAPLVRSVLDGYNVCIFAYGQTGSGKTHTMSGTDVGRLSGRGVNYRTLDDLFALRTERAADARYAIRVQLLEIYNETLRDLLVEGAAAGGQARSLALNNTARSGVNVPDATQVTVECTEDVLRVMELGARNRAVAETRMNERSSRSHQVLTILVEGEGLNTRARTHACLHLIDLAGSERIGKSGAEGQQLVEAQHINKSLSALGNVMHALASKSAHIPFRDSKLTQLLQDSLAGQAKTMMFVHVAPEASSLSETLSTLNFGKGVTEITLGAARKNTEPGAVFEARDAAGRHEREAAAARVALAERSARCQELEGEVEALHLALAAANRMAAEGRAAAAAERPASAGSPG
ncbi:Kinesin-4 [Auxenochlorella protothecoides]|uniref:Kinesin-4 n=1 Tax=Auxenochlorella protothecoides TaxID=3075 RepID=A0A087SIR1_AUXPR|nr:Kinesin-4 [Auxenochlorella protothecoides]KFM25615.1 Kinesin-4 [Auxenochlorella protothecoides]